MEKAKIVVFEDSETIRRMLRTAADITGHVIIAEADTVSDAVELIETHEFDAAIVDGNLDAEQADCTDGKLLIDELKVKQPAAAIIWFSSIPATAVKADCYADTGKDAFAAMDALDRL